LITEKSVRESTSALTSFGRPCYPVRRTIITVCKLILRSRRGICAIEEQQSATFVFLFVYSSQM